jgi:hypothetical protein
LVHPDSRAAVEVAEQFADGLVGWAELASSRTTAEAAATTNLRALARNQSGAEEALLWAARAAGGVALGPVDPHSDAAMVARDAARCAALSAARTRSAKADDSRWDPEAEVAWHTERAAQAQLLHDIFGNPSRPVAVHESWLRWHDSSVPRIAGSLYEERRFADLPMLADALVDAGCDNPELLEHCRAGGEHVRGCWVVDLLLGKS